MKITHIGNVSGITSGGGEHPDDLSHALFRVDDAPVPGVSEWFFNVKRQFWKLGKGVAADGAKSYALSVDVVFKLTANDEREYFGHDGYRLVTLIDNIGFIDSDRFYDKEQRWPCTYDDAIDWIENRTVEEWAVYVRSSLTALVSERREIGPGRYDNRKLWSKSDDPLLDRVNALLSLQGARISLVKKFDTIEKAPTIELYKVDGAPVPGCTGNWFFTVVKCVFSQSGRTDIFHTLEAFVAHEDKEKDRLHNGKKETVYRRLSIIGGMTESKTTQEYESSAPHWVETKPIEEWAFLAMIKAQEVVRAFNPRDGILYRRVIEEYGAATWSGGLEFGLNPNAILTQAEAQEFVQFTFTASNADHTGDKSAPVAPSIRELDRTEKPKRSSLLSRAAGMIGLGR